MIQTSRLTLRKLTESDLDSLADMTANPDFMRFSLGVFSRKQAKVFLEKILAGFREGVPSQFAVIVHRENKLIGNCGFFRQMVDDVEEIEIGYRLDPGIGGKASPRKQPARCGITRFKTWVWNASFR